MFHFIIVHLQKLCFRKTIGRPRLFGVFTRTNILTMKSNLVDVPDFANQTATSSTLTSPHPNPAAAQPPNLKFGFQASCVTAVPSS